MDNKKAIQEIFNGTTAPVITFCGALWGITPTVTAWPSYYPGFAVLAEFLYNTEATQEDMDKVAEVYPIWKPFALHGREFQWLYKHKFISRLKAILDHLSECDPVPEELWKIE